MHFCAIPPVFEMALAIKKTTVSYSPTTAFSAEDAEYLSKFLLEEAVDGEYVSSVSTITKTNLPAGMTLTPDQSVLMLGGFHKDVLAMGQVCLDVLRKTSAELDPNAVKLLAGNTAVIEKLRDTISSFVSSEYLNSVSGQGAKGKRRYMSFHLGGVVTELLKTTKLSLGPAVKAQFEKIATLNPDQLYAYCRELKRNTCEVIQKYTDLINQVYAAAQNENARYLAYRERSKQRSLQARRPVQQLENSFQAMSMQSQEMHYPPQGMYPQGMYPQEMNHQAMYHQQGAPRGFDKPCDRPHQPGATCGATFKNNAPCKFDHSKGFGYSQ